jgi:hypothetical protein
MAARSRLVPRCFLERCSSLAELSTMSSAVHQKQVFWLPGLVGTLPGAAGPLLFCYHLERKRGTSPIPLCYAK